MRFKDFKVEQGYQGLTVLNKTVSKAGKMRV